MYYNVLVVYTKHNMAEEKNDNRSKKKLANLMKA